ncbi:DEKNAAC104772, partial [Brettanomyces naardenensis]
MNNSLNFSLEISRIFLCLDIFTVGIELPKRYIYSHFWSVISLLVPVMTIGWLIIGLFIWLLIPRMTFAYGLLISSTITATDPVLAQAVVGRGKFAKRVPEHLRNILTAESACNDGMAVPFVYLASNLILHAGDGGAIAKNFICLAVLYECVFGIILGGLIGFVGRKLIRLAHEHGFIERECILVFYLVLSVMSAGLGSTLGADDLLSSFAAGCAFSWDGWVA